MGGEPRHDEADLRRQSDRVVEVHANVLGTRHRAAIGVTEETDAVAIIVSEETGAISFAHDGEMERYLDADTLRLRLRDAFERKAITSPRVAPAANTRR